MFENLELKRIKMCLTLIVGAWAFLGSPEASAQLMDCTYHVYQAVVGSKKVLEQAQGIEADIRSGSDRLILFSSEAKMRDALYRGMDGLTTRNSIGLEEKLDPREVREDITTREGLGRWVKAPLYPLRRVVIGRNQMDRLEGREISITLAFGEADLGSKYGHFELGSELTQSLLREGFKLTEKTALGTASEKTVIAPPMVIKARGMVLKVEGKDTNGTSGMYIQFDGAIGQILNAKGLKKGPYPNSFFIFGQGWHGETFATLQDVRVVGGFFDSVYRDR
jgi:hypothetical protein